MRLPASFTVPLHLLYSFYAYAKEKCKRRVVLDDTAGGWPFHLMPPHLE